MEIAAKTHRFDEISAKFQKTPENSINILRTSARICKLPEIQFAHLVDLEKSEKMNIWTQKIGVDTAEKEPSEV